MKVLLTQPLTLYVEEPPHIPDLGLGYIATQLTNESYDVTVNDWNMNSSVDGFKKRLSQYQPNVVGMKIFTKDVRAAKTTMATFREILPQVTIFIGGPHPSSSERVELTHDFSACNYRIRGEAELSFLALLAVLEPISVKETSPSISFEKVRHIPGLVWKENETNHSNPISFVADLGSTRIPIWEMMDPNDYQGDVFFAPKKKGYRARHYNVWLSGEMQFLQCIQH